MSHCQKLKKNETCFKKCTLHEVLEFKFRLNIELFAATGGIAAGAAHRLREPSRRRRQPDPPASRHTADAVRQCRGQDSRRLMYCR